MGIWAEAGAFALQAGVPAVATMLLGPAGGIVGGSLVNLGVQWAEGNLNSWDDVGWATLGGAAGGLSGWGLGGALARRLGTKTAESAVRALAKNKLVFRVTGADAVTTGRGIGYGVGNYATQMFRNTQEPVPPRDAVKGDWVGKPPREIEGERPYVPPPGETGAFFLPRGMDSRFVSNWFTNDPKSALHAISNT